MALDKSLESCYALIAALLRDVSQHHAEVFNTRSCELTLCKVRKRCALEGMGFFTKTLPLLGKAFDRALAGGDPLNATSIRFAKLGEKSELPRFLGEFISRVLQPNGALLPAPVDTGGTDTNSMGYSLPSKDAEYVRIVRDICFLFYKYELPYDEVQEREVISRFITTERDLLTSDVELEAIRQKLPTAHERRRLPVEPGDVVAIAREARIKLSNLFAFFDPRDITPRHGPGAVSTKEQLWEKYLWTNVARTVTDCYPLDEYYYTSLGHVCDRLHSLDAMTDRDHPARVILVPKDSRGPRLISCEPCDKQWIQQGLGRAIVKHVEQHPLSRENVRFTDQQANRNVALLASRDGRYSTLDLNEASDRVSLQLVRLLFPDWLMPFLEACRSASTVLPSGEVLKLRKFAPMGSALCFPVLALTVWALLDAAAPDEYTRNRILVYGDDVIVPTAYAETAMKTLTAFGLKINRDKSCTGGLFRESCGMDAFKGVCVTPLRIRTVWSSEPSAGVYTSWIAYANQAWDRQYYHVYNTIVDMLSQTYGTIPDEALLLNVPSLRGVRADSGRRLRKRWNRSLQKVEYRVRVVLNKPVVKKIDGWSMLLRYFTEGSGASINTGSTISNTSVLPFEGYKVFTSSSYTKRDASMLALSWR